MLAYHVFSLWFYCSQRLLAYLTFQSFGLDLMNVIQSFGLDLMNVIQSFGLDLMNVILETCT
jgi:hypothetical protein